MAAASRLFLDRENESLHDRNTAVLANCAVAWRANSPAFDPAPLQGRLLSVLNQGAIATHILGWTRPPLGEPPPT